MFATTCQVDYSKKQGIIPVGRPIPNYRVIILGQDGQLLPPGLMGEVSIGGIGVSSGYINRPEETHRRFRSSSLQEVGVASIPFHLTGDEGWLSHDGMLYFRGRIAGDTQIKLRYGSPASVILAMTVILIQRVLSAANAWTFKILNRQ